MRKTLIILLSTLSLVSDISAGNMEWMYEDHSQYNQTWKIPENDCIKPIVPNTLDINQEVKLYNKQKSTYINCIKKFIYKQKLIIKNTKIYEKKMAHKKAIRQSIYALKLYLSKKPINNFRRNFFQKNNKENPKLIRITKKQ